MGDVIIREARAKINLSLDVTGRREDGYHLVRMVMQTVSLADRLTFEKTGVPGISLSCEDSTLPCGSGNLVWRAADLLMQEFHAKEGVRIRLEKKIPAAAGLAGGSSDAAAALKAVNELFGFGLTEAQLAARAVKLGADVPYCLRGGTALAEGIGEILTDLPAIPHCWIVLAKPAAGAATGGVYGRLDQIGTYAHPDVDGQIRAIENGSLPGICGTLGNVLELVTGSDLPVIGRIEAHMRQDGAIGACMSGSGPTVFGIFDDEAAAENVCRSLPAFVPAGNIFLTEPVS